VCGYNNLNIFNEGDLVITDVTAWGRRGITFCSVVLKLDREMKSSSTRGAAKSVVFVSECVYFSLNFIVL